MPVINVQWIQLVASDAGILVREPQAVQLQAGATVRQALAVIGFDASQIETWLFTRAVALHGQYALADTVLVESDRIEILDTLQFDPMESRRRRAIHKNNQTPRVRKSQQVA